MSGLEKLFEEHNTILRQIAEGLDALVMGQESMVQSLDSVVDIAEDILDAVQPLEITSTHELPGFDGDPLKNFPSIRKEKPTDEPTK